MKYYKDCSIPVYNFFEFIYERDYNLLLINPKKKIKEKDKELLDEVFKKIFYEYCYLSGDMTLLASYKKEINNEFLLYKINFGKQVLEIYYDTEYESVLDLLEEIDLKINKENDLNSEIEKVIRQIKALETRYNVLNPKNKKPKERKKPNLNSEALEIELALGMKYPIDIFKCPLSKWIPLILKVKSKIK